MRKLIILFAALTLCVGLWANDIYYVSNTALRNFDDNAFDLPISTHGWNESTRNGNIFFNGDVTEIGVGAFQSCSGMTSITLPNTIKVIGDQAFYFCSGLTSFTIPTSVKTIGYNAFNTCYSLTSITIPSSVTSIGNRAFASCTSLTAVTFEETTCQNAIGGAAFESVGSVDKPATLTLPEDWNYNAAPESNTKTWYGGYFNSNLYSKDETTDKQAAIDAITAILGEYATSTYLQNLLAEETAKINSAANKPQVDEKKQAARERLTFAVSNYAAGDTAGYQRAKAELPTDSEGTPGTAVVVTKGDKSVTLINPESVKYLKVTE